MHSAHFPRRKFIALLGAATAGWPFVAYGQRGTGPLVAHLHAGGPTTNKEAMKEFERGLGQAGFVNGRNVTVEYHWAQGQYERLPAMAAELVQRQVSVIAVGTPVAALAAKRATSSIPIVFAVGSDPVENGFVASLNRPGGNMTGATFYSNLLTRKRLALFRELLPNAKVVGTLVNPKNANAQFQINEALNAARELALNLIMARASDGGEIDSAIDDLKRQNVDGILILSDSFLNSSAERIASRALRYSLPTCFAYREPAEAGGLMGYGANRTEVSFRAGVYVGRILKGERPADLPVLQPTMFEFVINMKTAKALGLAVPATLLARAESVIE